MLDTSFLGELAVTDHKRTGMRCLYLYLLTTWIELFNSSLQQPSITREQCVCLVENVKAVTGTASWLPLVCGAEFISNRTILLSIYTLVLNLVCLLM